MLNQRECCWSGKGWSSRQGSKQLRAASASRAFRYAQEVDDSRVVFVVGGVVQDLAGRRLLRLLLLWRCGAWPARCCRCRCAAAAAHRERAAGAAAAARHRRHAAADAVAAPLLLLWDLLPRCLAAADGKGARALDAALPLRTGPPLVRSAAVLPAATDRPPPADKGLRAVSPPPWLSLRAQGCGVAALPDQITQTASLGGYGALDGRN